MKKGHPWIYNEISRGKWSHRKVEIKTKVFILTTTSQEERNTSINEAHLNFCCSHKETIGGSWSKKHRVWFQLMKTSNSHSKEWRQIPFFSHFYFHFLCNLCLNHCMDRLLYLELNMIATIIICSVLKEYFPIKKLVNNICICI